MSAVWTVHRPERRGVARSGLLLLLLAALSLGIAWSWPVPAPRATPLYGDGLIAVTGKRGPVHLEGMDTTLVWRSTGHASVGMTLVNTSDQPQDAQVWWILGKIGEKQVWKHPVVRSATSSVHIPPRSTRTVDVRSGAATITPGSYGLSGWVHYVSKGASLHSDGRSIASFIDVTAVHSSSDGLATPAGNYVASTVAAQDRTGSKTSVNVRIVNPTDEPRQLRVWVTAQPSGGVATPPRSTATNVTIAPAKDLTVALPVSAPPNHSQYDVHVWLADVVPAPLVSPARLSDTVSLP